MVTMGTRGLRSQFKRARSVLREDRCSGISSGGRSEVKLERGFSERRREWQGVGARKRV